MADQFFDEGCTHQGSRDIYTYFLHHSFFILHDKNYLVHRLKPKVSTLTFSPILFSIFFMCGSDPDSVPFGSHVLKWVIWLDKVSPLHLFIVPGAGVAAHELWCFCLLLQFASAVAAAEEEPAQPARFVMLPPSEATLSNLQRPPGGSSSGQASSSGSGSSRVIL